MNPPTVRAIRMGTSWSYLLATNGGVIVVDAGVRGFASKFIRILTGWGYEPGDVRLLVVSHVHFDHVGSLAAIKEWCGAPVVVHGTEAALLASATVVLAPGTNPWGRSMSWLGRRIGAGVLKFRPVSPDILVDEELSLERFGMPGRLWWTPGHTMGSLSLLWGDAAIIGDLAVNYLPGGRGPIFPPYARDVPTLLQSWRRLLDADIRLFHPAHGQPFTAARLAREYALRTRVAG